MLDRRRLLGQSGEAIASKHVKKNGYKIVEKNFRCRFGEIDIIARDGSCLVFIEVKTRTSDRFGPPAASVDSRKQRQICRVTNFYLTKHNIEDCDIRFDVVAITLTKNKQPEVEIITNAFEYCL